MSMWLLLEISPLSRCRPGCYWGSWLWVSWIGLTLLLAWIQGFKRSNLNRLWGCMITHCLGLNLGPHAIVNLGGISPASIEFYNAVILKNPDLSVRFEVVD